MLNPLIKAALSRARGDLGFRLTLCAYIGIFAVLFFAVLGNHVWRI